MALFGTGSSTAYWRAPVWTAVPGGPYSLSCWVKNIPGSTVGIFQFQTGASGSPQTGIGTFNAALYFQDYQDASHNYQLFGTTSTYLPATATTWHHLLWAETAAGVVTGWIDGVAFAPAPTIVGTLAATARTELAVANNWANTAGLSTTALIAETAWWQELLSGADARALYQGTSPLRVRTGRLRNYWPLRGSLSDAGPAQVGLVPVGGASAVYGEHPRVELPPRRRLLKAAGASGAALASSVNAVSTASADLTTAITMTAAPAGSSTVAAALSTQIPLAAVLSASTTAVAALTTAITPAAGIAAASTVSASLTTAITMAAAPSAVSAVGAGLTTQITLSAGLSGVASVSSALTTAITPFAGLTGISTVAGNLTTAIPLAAAPTSVSTLSAALTTSIVLVAAPSAVTTVIATMAGTSAALAANLAGRSSLAADLTTAIALNAVVAGSSAAAANLTTSIRLSLALAGAAAVAANLTTAIPLSAASAGSTTVAAALSTGISLASAIQVGSAATASLTTSIRMVAALVANSQIVADLATLSPLPSVIDAGHVAVFATDSRFATIPVDSRTVTLSGNA